jgi:formylglycine-generating enzyme required for sulfatase activity
LIQSVVTFSHAGVVTFGTGSNAFQMEFVKIGNPGNAADTSGDPNPAGAVGYEYGIGKFEVSRNMITKYNAAPENSSLKISLEDMTFWSGNGPNKPATGISWNEAARFVNWLNTSTGGFAAYKFTTAGVNDNIALWTAADTLDYNAANPYRSKRARYVLPSNSEWYKAAYYDPNARIYWDFPNGSNAAPTAVASGTTSNTAVYNRPTSLFNGPADVDQAGGLSPYGVMGLGGNVWEWLESPFNFTNISSTSSRVWRGGVWLGPSSNLHSAVLGNGNPNKETAGDGFRVASVPEPSSLVIGTLFGLGGLLAKRRMKR